MWSVRDLDLVRDLLLAVEEVLRVSLELFLDVLYLESRSVDEFFRLSLSLLYWFCRR